jgi:hypothetical protein
VLTVLLQVAEGVLNDLQRIPEASWNNTSATKDYAHNNISHEFSSVRHVPAVEAIVRVLSLLLPDMLHSFSAAKYERNDHIAPHDDRAYTQVGDATSSSCGIIAA